MPEFIQKNIPLAPYTTLGAGGAAEYFAEVRSLDELKEAVHWAKVHALTVRLLAGGSNVLVPDAGVSGLVLRPQFTDVVYEDMGEDVVHAEVGAGVALDAFVAETVLRGLWGIENLSGIPGSVGATPVQNVGAYGVEVKDVITSVRVYDIASETFSVLENRACTFAYRDSLFKRAEGKDLIITHVTFALSKKPDPKITYKDLALYFAENPSVTLSKIRDAVLTIRSKKFPDWTVVGTAGSFFKNPLVSEAQYVALSKKYPEMPAFLGEGGSWKLSLGWILDRVCGLKGYREGRVGLYEAQALVLVCEKGTTAREIETFAEKIIAMVFEKTSVRVEREVTTI